MRRKLQTNGAFETEKRGIVRKNVQTWAKEIERENTRFHLVSNLSPQGLLIEKKLPLSVGAVIDLELDMPNLGEKLRVRGVVTNTYKDSDSNIRGTGVRFTSLSKEARRKLQAFIESFETKQGQA